MVTKDWAKVILEKIAIAKARGSKKRGWIKLSKSWLISSINYRMELSEQAVFAKLLLFADDLGPVPGLISDNDFRAMPHDYLAHLACCPPEVLEATLKKAVDDDSVFENGHGIFLTHFDEYQFTEYDRQRPYREKKPYGEFLNVLLTDAEKGKLIEKFGAQGFMERVKGLSLGIESKGYKYKSHYAAILVWDRMEKKRSEENRGNTGGRSPKTTDNDRRASLSS